MELSRVHHMQAGAEWNWLLKLLLTFFIAGVPIFMLAILQNFYVQSIMFAHQETAAMVTERIKCAQLSCSKVEATATAAMQAKWQERLVRTVVPVTLAMRDPFCRSAGPANVHVHGCAFRTVSFLLPCSLSLWQGLTFQRIVWHRHMQPRKIETQKRQSSEGHDPIHAATRNGMLKAQYHHAQRGTKKAYAQLHLLGLFFKSRQFTEYGSITNRA
jgi:hypothetical protein